MNRQERRARAAAAAINNNKRYPIEKAPTIVSRPDGRPEAYDPPMELDGAACAMCVHEGRIGLRYKRGEIVMMSPIDSSDGQAHLVCIGHLPKNIVIYDPVTNVCRNRDGSYTWRELEGGLQVPFVPPKDVGLLDHLHEEE